MIRNFLDWETVRESSHDGDGFVTVQNVFQPSDFKGGWDHAVRTVMPAGTSIGVHKHGQNEEMYIILKGEGLMIVDGDEHRVREGDMIQNRPDGSHGLRNDSDADIELLIIQASLSAGA